MSLRVVALACGALGVALLFPFDHTLTLIGGVAFLLAFVVCGVFAIADPGFLEGDDPPG